MESPAASRTGSGPGYLYPTGRQAWLYHAMTLDQHRLDLKAAFIAAHGAKEWSDSWESVLALSPEIFAASLKLSSVPKKKRHLEPKIQRLLALAVDCASTHLFVPGIRSNVQAALKEGASVAEVVEVIECSSTLGIHACNIGVPLLVEVLREEGLTEKFADVFAPLDERQERLKADFTVKRGYWHEFWEDFLRMDPEFFEAYLDFSSVPWTKHVDGSTQGALEPKVKEFVYCAFDVAATHLYQPGLKLHMRNALNYGATPQEIMEVLEIATLLSLHTIQLELKVSVLLHVYPKFVTRLPAPSADQVYVMVSALDAGFLTLPEYLFVTDAEPSKRVTVPSMAFLISHPSSMPGTRPTTLLFDMGVKKDLAAYAPANAAHIAQRQPVITDQDVADSLRLGGLDPVSDIDYVMLSHVHWDHIGTPSDFPNSKFVVGSGTLHLLQHGAPPNYPAELFDPNTLPRERTYELPPVSPPSSTAAAQQTEHKWTSVATLPHAIDFFGDGSVYVVDSPGHLFGHVNLLARIAPGRWVYLGGDCCHDVRILKGEKDIALYDDGKGGLRSVHVNTDEAKTTLKRVRVLLEELAAQPDGEHLEVVVAHDSDWRKANPHRFFPGIL